MEWFEKGKCVLNLELEKKVDSIYKRFVFLTDLRRFFDTCSVESGQMHSP